MTAPTATSQDLGRALAAAEAAVALLPASSPLSTATPTQDTSEITLEGQVIRARFAGAAQGEILVMVAQDLVDALGDTPLGSLDVTQAVRPAIEAAAGTLGPVVVDPGNVTDTADALASLVAEGGVLVPLTDGTDVRGVVGLLVKVDAAAAVNPATPSTPSASSTQDPSAAAPRTGLDLLHDVEMEVTAELGRTRMSVRELLSLNPGNVVELDRAAGAPADLLVNGRLIARGEVVVIDENFGIRITEIISPSEQRS
ncbi:flagellar motor switch protein FliN [Planosporangium thailandense]|uniref:Flagellar motor switch protein FliN n=1 Tax=Planosporangium thailandense TaxID=765197 RepID=A0ABX0Y0V9_9ACTN|nr:flagellar motor switch protein FliN [Planosporangium thailandense]NJC71782.1 flagellar motor switch protein FliN [Planosporangium thailandense]